MNSKVRAIMIMVALIGLSATCIYWYTYEEPNKTIKEQPGPSCDTNKIDTWVPTKEDIAYQDSMYQIIQNTQSDVDTIKVHIDYILERLEYPDGTYDSIRIVSNKNKENQSR